MKLSINKVQLSSLDKVLFDGDIHVVDTIDKVNDAISFLSKHEMLGFDTETKPSFRKGVMHNVALMQISTLNDCYLFRLNKLGGVPESLNELLENDKITKIGLSLKDDFGMIHRISSANPLGFIDLQKMVPHYNITDASLQKIYAIIFDGRISKSQRLTNWEADTLTDSQKRYAAIDAWACLKIYNYLKSGSFNPQTSKYVIDEENEKV